MASGIIRIDDAETEAAVHSDGLVRIRAYFLPTTEGLEIVAHCAPGKTAHIELKDGTRVHGTITDYVSGGLDGQGDYMVTIDVEGL